jgi:AraC family transcriptional regulator
MEWSERMNSAVDYIEENLTGEMDLSQAAGRACCSSFYFQRIFLAVTDLTPVEYIRRRRLTLAAGELSSSQTRVIDIALKYGYDSPEAFARAFRNLHGVTPAEARQPGVKLTAFPRIFFHIELKGGKDLDYRIIEKPAFQVALTARQFNNLNGQNLKEIPEWWGEFEGSPDWKALTALSGDKPGGVTGGIMLGVCYGESKGGNFYYGIAVELPAGVSPGKFDRMLIPATTWAVFECTLANLQEVSKHVFGEWYISTGHEHSGGPDLEVYLPEVGGQAMPCQIWAPLKNKKK